MVNLHDGKEFDFIADLEDANKRENELFDILNSKKIELKTEMREWVKTGNIFIEMECYGKPSGVMASQSYFWVHELRNPKTNTPVVYMMFPIKIIRGIANLHKNTRYISGIGENGGASGVLVSVSELFNYWTKLVDWDE